MPYEIRKEDGKYRLFNLSKSEYAKSEFNTRQSAVNQGKNWMRYRHETPHLQGNKILPSRLKTHDGEKKRLKN
jgi:hypothetical protein